MPTGLQWILQSLKLFDQHGSLTNEYLLNWAQESQTLIVKQAFTYLRQIAMPEKPPRPEWQIFDPKIINTPSDISKKEPIALHPSRQETHWLFRLAEAFTVKTIRSHDLHGPLWNLGTPKKKEMTHAQLILEMKQMIENKPEGLNSPIYFLTWASQFMDYPPSVRQLIATQWAPLDEKHSSILVTKDKLQERELLLAVFLASNSDFQYGLFGKNEFKRFIKEILTLATIGNPVQWQPVIIGLLKSAIPVNDLDFLHKNIRFVIKSGWGIELALLFQRLMHNYSASEIKAVPFDYLEDIELDGKGHPMMCRFALESRT